MSCTSVCWSHPLCGLPKACSGLHAIAVVHHHLLVALSRQALPPWELPHGHSHGLPRAQGKRRDPSHSTHSAPVPSLVSSPQCPPRCSLLRPLGLPVQVWAGLLPPPPTAAYVVLLSAQPSPPALRLTGCCLLPPHTLDASCSSGSLLRSQGQETSVTSLVASVPILWKDTDLSLCCGQCGARGQGSGLPSLYLCALVLRSRWHQALARLVLRVQQTLPRPGTT